MCSHCQPGEPCAGEGDKLRLYLLRGAAAQRTFSGQHLENFEVILAILDFELTGFSLPGVCVSVAHAPQTHPSSRICASLLAGEGGDDEKPSMFRASINELKLISEPYCQKNTLRSLSLFFCVSLCDTHLFGKGQL